MKEIKDGDDDHDDDDDHYHNSEHVKSHNLSSEAAGVVRGVSRSIGKSIAKSSKNISKVMPKQVPRLSREFFTRRGRLRVRTVAKASDRLSTGWDVYSSAMESVEEVSDTKVQKKVRSWGPILVSVRTFAFTLLRNSVAGAIVFETYVFTISQLTTRPPPFPPQDKDDKRENKEICAHDDNDPSTNVSKLEDVQDDEDDDVEEIVGFDEQKDDFVRASLLAHVGAGALAGSLDGFLSSAWESKFQSNSWRFFQQKAPFMVLQQSISHALLFGSYEFCKRTLVHQMHSMVQYGKWNIHDSGLWHLGCIAIAGGVAGQLQFLTSHYGDQVQETKMFVTSSNQIARNQLLSRLSALKHPNIGSMVGAFLPSAIGFIAFEYGKRL